jgi:hypothetical protein
MSIESLSGKRLPLLAGVGRANNANNVGNANNVNGVAAPYESLFRPIDFADNNQNGRTSQSASDLYSDAEFNRALWDLICSEQNITLAFNKVIGYIEPEQHKERVKAKYRDFLENRERDTKHFAERLRNGWEFGEYAEMKVYEPKERSIHYHADWWDNVAETAVLNVIALIYIGYYSEHTYGSIKGRGTTKMLNHLAQSIKQHKECYYLQIDVRKYYQSINPQKLLKLVNEVISCTEVRAFVKRLVGSYSGGGIPIGVPMSQFHGNLYLTPLDKLLESDARVIDFARNMDDVAVIVKCKQDAHEILARIEALLAEYDLQVKPNKRIAPVTCGMDILGYVIYPTHIRLRKRIKLAMQRRARQLSKGNVPNKVYKQQMASYYGWCSHANARHLLQRTMGDKLNLYMKYKRLSDIKPKQLFFGLPKEKFISITTLSDVEVLFLEVLNCTIKTEPKIAIRFCLCTEISDEPAEQELAEHSYYTITRSAVMADRLSQDKGLMPFAATIRQKKYTYYE